MQNIVKLINQNLNHSPNESINEVFGEIKTVLSLKEPTNLLRVLSLNRKNPGFFTCNNKSCKLCALYIKQCTSFKTSNNVIWYIRSHITFLLYVEPETKPVLSNTNVYETSRQVEFTIL